ncbi:S1 RNA-binding domain-containing protein [uncultured Methanobrevibacter sp.]|uniref:S1 RNA-binding domain-containing protein n=1 Tax=uncultured Methanobrevibacter sp. TaxID=253161 RepID=UPI0025D3DA62|nr:S1 RNA-binding domain-containing protein [uncultured Methanobrevibacter sp.]MBR4590730.1 30S ribosomal protein S1 [Bacteroidaceae bacterium]
MKEQYIDVLTDANCPYETKTIKVKVGKREKILCHEPYVLEDLDKYNKYLYATNYNESLPEQNIKGRIVSINVNNGVKVSALIDLNGKYSSECNLLKEPDYIVDQLEVGMEVDVKARTVNHNLILSIGEAVNDAVRNDIFNNIGKKNSAYKGKVLSRLNGGYWVSINGVTCFMPGSLVALNKINDFDKFIGKEMEFMPVSYSKEKQTIVVSHREYLHTLIPSAIKDLHKNIKNQITGFVTGTTKFGVFCEFNECLTGLIAKDDLDEETLEKFNRNEINPDDTISFWVKEIVSDKKILLSQKGPIKDEWEEAVEEFKEKDGGVGTITKITDFGITVELKKGVYGFINKYRVKDKNLKKGDNVFYRITNINMKDKKISLDLIF